MRVAGTGSAHRVYSPRFVVSRNYRLWYPIIHVRLLQVSVRLLRTSSANSSCFSLAALKVSLVSLLSNQWKKLVLSVSHRHREECSIYN